MRSSTRPWRFVLPILPFTIAILAGFSGLAASGPVKPGADIVILARNVKHFGTLPSQLLFIPTENGTINIYPLKDPNETGPIAQITGLIAFQEQMVVDANKNLFVVNNGSFGNDDFVSEYAPPYNGPPKILQTVVNSSTQIPVGVAVDAQGTVYVSTCGAYCGGQTPYVLVYANGSLTPTSVITSSQFNSLGGLAIDRQGNLYVGAWNATTFGADVLKIAAGSTSPTPLRLHGLVAANIGLTNGISLDTNGNLFVSSSNGTNYVLEFKLGRHNAYRIIDPWVLLTEPLMIDVGPDGNLYVPTGCVNTPCASVYGFKPGDRKPFETVGTSGTEAVATSPNLQLQGAKKNSSRSSATRI